MKISPVSFRINSKGANTDFEHHFLYTAPEHVRKSPPLEHFQIATGVLALAAVLVTLFNLGARKKLPKTVFVV